MRWNNIPVDPEFYSADHDPEFDHGDPYKCNECQAENVDTDGDVCQACYDAE
jgi:hypothetical protein